jgi:broad specificity phosphatase PhoE
MARIHLVRHGQASAGFDADPDPGLDDLGRAQAVKVASELVTKGPMPIRTSPLLRCQETAEPLAALWGAEPIVDPAVTEVAAPTADLAGRSVWLRGAMAGEWSALEDAPRRWRDTLLGAVAAIDIDTVIFTHFVAINAVIGAATGSDRVLVERLANGSRTVVETRPEGLVLVEAGGSGTSAVL